MKVLCLPIKVSNSTPKLIINRIYRINNRYKARLNIGNKCKTSVNITNLAIKLLIAVLHHITINIYMVTLMVKQII